MVVIFVVVFYSHLLVALQFVSCKLFGSGMSANAGQPVRDGESSMSLEDGAMNVVREYGVSATRFE